MTQPTPQQVERAAISKGFAEHQRQTFHSGATWAAAHLTPGTTLAAIDEQVTATIAACTDPIALSVYIRRLETYCRRVKDAIRVQAVVALEEGQAQCDSATVEALPEETTYDYDDVDEPEFHQLQAALNDWKGRLQAEGKALPSEPKKYIRVTLKK